MNDMRIASFRRIVWNYYKKHGRGFPWRSTKNPYRIYVSEIMLQQTQVTRVLLKYSKFLKVFPSVQILARAPLPKLLCVWQGMGYNRRAINMRRAAEMMAQEFDARVPRDPEQLVRLPGVGQATAGSIAVFAYNQPVVFIETNIRRVFLHHFFARRSNVSDEDLFPYIARALPRAHAREWYSALMDYGTHLAVAFANPNRRSARYRLQTRFEGSDRQLRGRIVKYVIGRKYVTCAQLSSEFGENPARVRRIMRQLAVEGFFHERARPLTDIF